MRTLTLMAGIVLLTACGSEGGGAANSTTPPADGSLNIGAIQGSGATSPLNGRTVTVTGLVTGDFQENDGDERRNLGGFYLQDTRPDADPSTSDGIFVFDGNRPSLDVSVGDVVEVSGEVAEYFGETQLNASVIRVIDSGTPEPLPIVLPAGATTTNSDGDVIADLERFEGMLVSFADALTVTDVRDLEQFGELRLSQGGRLFQFTNGNAPDAVGYAAHKDLNARRAIFLDDGLRTRNPATIHHRNVRAGDTVTDLVGNLRYARGSGANGDETWRLMPTIDPDFESANPRPGPPTVGGTVRATSFNVENFFTTIDAGQNDCGPAGNEGCRGADSRAEYRRQLDKIVTALAMLDADVIGLVELENNAEASLVALVDALNTRLGNDAYDYVDTGTIHDDVIKTGFIYRTTAIGLQGRFALLDNSVDSRFNDARNRPALAQTFVVRNTGALFTVVINHLKSKGSPCDAEGDPNRGDGQGNCNSTRTSAAAAIADWLATDPTNSGDEDFLILGDLNAYTREDPLAALADAGLVNLLDSAPNPYSFSFDAQAGALDHAVATASMAAQVVEAIEWHINADEPDLHDYNLEHGRDPALFDATTPYRASDHDPVIVGFDPTE